MKCNIFNPYGISNRYDEYEHENNMLKGGICGAYPTPSCPSARGKHICNQFVSGDNSFVEEK